MLLPESDIQLGEKRPSLDELFFKYRFLLLIILAGLILIGLGIFLLRNELELSGAKVEVLERPTESETAAEIVVEVSGEVVNPGVYKFPEDARVDDLLIMSGGLTANADRVWVEKTLNRAAKLIDGQKIFIPSMTEQSNVLSANNSGGDQTASSNFPVQNSGLVNINTASLAELDLLPGIGQVYGQNIIDHRPYSNIEELLSKGVLKKYVFEKIKDKVSVY